jgi:co-chaperonin GroES (HSP10)
MINDNMKKMIMPLYNNLILRPYAENPYIEKKTKSGLLINDDQFKSQDSGEEEKLNELIRCAEVVEVGPECKYVKPGDDIFYNVVTVKPVPFQRQGFLLLNEVSVLAVMNDDLDERIWKK